MKLDSLPHPTLDSVRATARRLEGRVLRTPLWPWRTRGAEELLGRGAEVHLKLELFQHTGTFKARGALANALALDDAARERGVTAVSAGNHAAAVAWAAHSVGTSAKVVMMEGANPARVALCREFGAEVELAADVHRAFERVREIERTEGRTFIHPFEGVNTVHGTATLGLELCEQLDGIDAVVVPIGGGGLCAGVSAAVKLCQPNATVYGVEPDGADTMHRSFASGQVESIDKVRTIADSLGAPYTEPYSLDVCRANVDELARISDDELRAAMRRLFDSMKLACEPAGAATTAALFGPLRERLQGQRVALIVCGSNTDLPTFARHASLAP